MHLASRLQRGGEQHCRGGYCTPACNGPPSCSCAPAHLAVFGSRLSSNGLGLPLHFDLFNVHAVLVLDQDAVVGIVQQDVDT